MHKENTDDSSLNTHTVVGINESGLHLSQQKPVISRSLQPVNETWWTKVSVYK